ncbi:YcnI family protein [Nocardioides sp. Kera G14]|uniref:YcnI family copper-binding membrane protein n=1 Tax=Nocardioides sp. Kera G14 TaxID=2884264 RepID=UPI001D125BA9|nr:YcnI family protein [Nocardioides sp. Kera G14]UDY24888.1 YcnI family protein [Nocardioides sp. Kera G14]
MKLTRPLAAAGVLSTVGSLLFLGAPAFAHVTVNPGTAPQGGYTKLTFRAPDESDTASTTKIEVQFPSDHPIASVRTRPVPGWTAKTTTTKPTTPLSDDDGPITEIVSTVTWTADSAKDAIQPGQFQEFDVSVGPLPTDADQIEFKALQTYSDGSIVRWIEEAGADGTEPEHPAPVLTLTPASADDASATAPATASGASSADHADDSDDSKAPLILSIIALVVAAGAAGASVLRRRA